MWTGPDGVHGGRLTSATIVDLISGAASSVLLIGYAVHSERSVGAALIDAHRRGVSITLVFERGADNPDFSGRGTPFPAVPARRLCWPARHRPRGASLHAKVLVVDESVALVGSANLTGAALARNIECGVLVKGGTIAARIVRHVDDLVRSDALVAV